MSSALEEPVVEQVLYKLKVLLFLLNCKMRLGFIPKQLIYSFN